MRSLLSYDAEYLFWITEKSDVSLAKKFTMDEVPSVKAFMSVRKDCGPRIEPCGTPALIFFPFRCFAHSEQLSGT